MNIATIILAAGKGTRMKSLLPKALHKTSANISLLEHVLNTSLALNSKEIIVVIGYEAEKVKELAENWKVKAGYSGLLKFALQKEQLGTGHACICATEALSSDINNVYILCGDIPLPSTRLLEGLRENHFKNKASFSIVSFEESATSSYGRILRDENSKIKAIKECKDCSASELFIREMNAGIYFSDKDFLLNALKNLKPNNNQAEYYITDLVSIALNQNLFISSVLSLDSDEVRGVNCFEDLQKINKYLNKKNIQRWAEQGVFFKDTETCFISSDAEFQVGTSGKIIEIGSNVQILSSCKISQGVKIDGNAVISNTSIGEDSHIKNFVQIENAIIADNCIVGPFANIRPESKLDSNVKIGNFVETKSAWLKQNVKASHLSYLGNCEVGEQTNIGAGTVFANYDGKNKFKTTVGESCFIGSNSTLVAPLSIGSNSTIGAGSVIRKNVENNSLAVTFGNLITRLNWKKKPKA